VNDPKNKKKPGSKNKPAAGKSEIIDTMLEMAVIPFFVDADDKEEERQEANTPTIQEMASEEDAAHFDDDDDDTIRMDIALDSLGPDLDD
jgi:hypothetical protein